jgi:hypothetical protein
MTFHEKTESIVKQACIYELAQAVLEHGDKFNSMHEGWAILKEEIEEVEDNFNRIKEYLDFLWKLVKRDSDSMKEFVSHIQDFTLDSMKELAQVWSVCEKMKKGVEE